MTASQDFVVPPPVSFGFDHAGMWGVCDAADRPPPNLLMHRQPYAVPHSGACDGEALQGSESPKQHPSRTRVLLVDNVLDEGTAKSGQATQGHQRRKKGAFSGVFVPTCENMFNFIVGQAGIAQALAAVFLCFGCAFCTASSMSATVSSGGIVSQGGPYHMISRTLGPCVGGSLGIMYWLAFTILAVLETLGAVECLLMASPQLGFTFCNQAFGSALLLALTLAVLAGINVVTKLGIFFAAIVFLTIFLYYFGLATVQAGTNPDITGLSFETFKENWTSHYSPGVDFGYILGVFFPCFTGILSGANRADILKDPPRNIKQGTFAAIVFSLCMYSSYMVMWGMVANYKYLGGGDTGAPSDGHGHGSHILEDIVWNPFPYAAVVGVIICSLSQALQCLVVAPRLLQSIAQDEILAVLKPLAPLRRGEPLRALLATFVVASLLVLIGKLDLVAPLLSMCFLVTDAFINFSCFALTWLRSPAWRPKGVHQKRWRLWYLGTGFLGFVSCITIMIIINPWWALAAMFVGLCLYFWINCTVEARGWGSAMDGIRYQLALTSLIQLEGRQGCAVNWRPQVLIMYQINKEAAEVPPGVKVPGEHGLLRFYSQLRKGKGFCVAACVLEGELNDSAAHAKARAEKEVIKSIMQEESISGFAEVVVSPSWAEGTNYIIQLTGMGGLSPNTVLLDWPVNWRRNQREAQDFVSVLRAALAADKAVMAIRGLDDMPTESVYGTIDIWWMIHDGGFLILLSWLLVQHKTWRKCHLRVFTITEGVSEDQAKAAAQLLTNTLRQCRLFDVDVEVILADDEMIEPYTYDWTLRVEDRHRFLHQLQSQRMDVRRMQAIPLQIDDLFKMEEERRMKPLPEATTLEETGVESHIVVSDIRTNTLPGLEVPTGSGRVRPTQEQRAQNRAVTAERAELTGGQAPASSSTEVPPSQQLRPDAGHGGPPHPPAGLVGREPDLEACQPERRAEPGSADHSATGSPELRPMSPPLFRPPVSRLEALFMKPEELSDRLSDGGHTGQLGRASTTSRLEALFQRPEEPSERFRRSNASTVSSSAARQLQPGGADGTSPRASVLAAMVNGSDAQHGSQEGHGHTMPPVSTTACVGAFLKLNQIIHTRSKRAQLVVMNLPDLRGDEPDEVCKFMSYCDTLTAGLERVLFVHASGREIFNLSA